MMMIMMMIRPHHKHASVEYRATHRLRSTTVAFASPISPPYTNYIFTVISDLFQSQTAQIFLLYICSLTHSFTAISKLSYFCPCVNITKNQCVCVLCIVYTLEHAIPSSFDVLNKLCKSTTIDSWRKIKKSPNAITLQTNFNKHNGALWSIVAFIPTDRIFWQNGRGCCACTKCKHQWCELCLFLINSINLRLLTLHNWQ